MTTRTCNCILVLVLKTCVYSITEVLLTKVLIAKNTRLTFYNQSMTSARQWGLITI